MVRLQVEIISGNAAMVDGAWLSELPRLLRSCADKIAAGSDGGLLQDVNGNTVGNYTLAVDEPED